MKGKQERLKRILTETIKSFINDNVKCHNTLSVEGLIGITLNNELFLVYVNESYTGVVVGVAANSDTCSGQASECDTCNGKASECDTCNGEASEGFDIVADESNILSCQNSLILTPSPNAGRDRDNGNGSQCSNIADISHGFDEAVGEMKPLVITSYWSEAATQDYGWGQHEPASTRSTTEEQCRINQSHDVMAKATSTSAPHNPLLIPTSTEDRVKSESVMEEAGGLYGRNNSDRRCLVKNPDILNSDSDRCMTGSAELKLDQHRTSDDGQESTLMANKSHVCDVCNKVFTHRYHLIRHDLVHAQVRYKYGKHKATSKYDKGSNQIGDCRPEHITSSGEQLVKGRNVRYCDICGLTFPFKSWIIKHMRTHTGEKPYACAVCKRAFICRSQLTEHMRTHTQEYACKVCKKAFSRPSYVTKHMRTHVRGKPHVCKVCERVYKRRSDLTVHMRKHTGEKPYACTVCKGAFCRCSLLTKHMRAHTGEKPYSRRLKCERELSAATSLDTCANTRKATCV